MTAKQPYTFASLLRHHREAAGLTQEELAGCARLGVRTISDLERGVSKAPYPSTVRRLAEALGLHERDRAELAASARHPSGQPRRADRGQVEGGFLGAAPTAPMVARVEELGRLSGALDASEGGSGRLVLLAGEPGVGKTRLAQEVGVRALERGFLVAPGRCYEAQGGVPFYPFLDALSALYEGASPAVRGTITERWPYVARLLPDHFPSQEAGPSENGEESQRLLRAVTGFVQDVSAEGPVALLIDDLHWADGTSVDLLAHLARHTRGDQVLLVGTYREVDVGSEHPLRKAVRELGREHLVQQIGIQSLGREETAALMSDRLNGAEVSEGFADLVYRHTESNPFFTVEVLKDLIERGDLSRWEGRWIRKEIKDLAAPTSVSEAISERVSRLQPGTQRVLEGASILGQAFDFEDLVAVAGLEEETVEEALDDAAASGLARAEMDGYAFDHALTQQSLYADLSPARRKRLHRSAGEGLQKLGETARRKRAAEISRHFEAASSPERALPYALLAGEEAEAAFAPTEAERQYRIALALAQDVGDGPTAARALERLGGVLAITVRYDEALAALERAADAYSARHESENAGRVEARIAQTHFRRGTPEEGIARLSSYLESLDGPGASEGVRRSLAALYCALARLYAAHMQYAECLEAAERGAVLSRTVEGIGSLAEAEMMRGIVLLWLDAPDEGVTTLETAILLAERSGTLDTLCNAFLVLHIAYRVRGEFDRSHECGERGMSIAKKTGDTDMLAMLTTNLGSQLFCVGDWREARVRLERAVELARDTQPSYFSCMPFVNLGVLLQAEGAREDASRCLSDAAARAQDASNPEMLGYARTRQAEQDVLQGRPREAIARLQPWLDASALTWIYDVVLLRVLAEAYVDTGDAARAEEVAEHAIVRAELMHNRVDGVEVLRVRAKILSMQGRHQEASAALEEALSRARSIPYPYAEGKILREHGMLHLREGEPEKARKRLSAALSIFWRLGARGGAGQTERALEATVRSR